MMSTSRASRPSKDKTKTQLQNVKSDSQPKNQATAEQMRIAELIQDKMSGADPEVKAKISQVMDVTGRSVDEALVALHDCDNDPTRAINMLLEGEADQGEWQESGKKKKKQVQVKPEVTSNNRSERAKSEDRQDDKIHEKDRDRDSLPPRRGKQPPRLARKMRENEENERNRNESSSRDRGFERGRGRGRGQANGAGRGRGRGRRGDRGGGGGNRFDRSQGPAIGTWTNETAENAEKENSMNTWDGMGEEWGDEWTGSLEETKVFTATSTTKVFEDTSKVFNSSDSSNVFNSNDSKVFGGNESSKVFGTGMGDNDAKMFQVPGHSDSLETQGFSASMSSMSNSNPAGSALNDSTNTLHTSTSLQNSISQNSLGQPSSLGQRLDLGMLLQKPSSTERESASQQQSQFMTQFTKHATEMLKNDLRIGTNSSNHVPTSGGGEPMQPASQTASSNKTQCSQAVGMKQKPQKSKLPPPSKIPASAVEMPGHLGGGSFQLDVQFGNWDFNTGDSGFTFGGSSSDSTSGVSSSFSSTPSSVTTSSSPLSSHGLSNKNGSDSSAMTTAVTTKTSVTGLDSIAQNTAQSPRANMYPNSNSTTPSKEYPAANKMSPPAAIPYPSGQSDRKMSPHYSQRPSSATSSSSHISQSKQGSSPPSLAYSQNNYTTNYQSSSFQSSGKPSPTSSYSHSANTGSLSNSGLSSQNQYNHSSYQSTSFQSQNAFTPSQQSLGHYSSGQSNSYPGQSSYQGQSSTYHSRDQPSSNAYQNSNSQSASYQGGSQNSYNSGSSQSGSYQRDSQPGQSAYSSHQTYASSGHQNSLQSSSMSNKLNDSLNKMSLKDSALDSHQSSQYDHNNSTNSTSLTTSSSSTTVNSLGSNSANVSTALGLTTTVVASPVTTTSTSSSKLSLPMTTSKAPPNLPPGVPPIISHNYMLAGQPGMPFAFANLAAQGLAAQQPAMYSYEDLQLLQQRLPMPGYYDMPFQPPTTLSRDQGLTNVPYSDGKLSRMEAQSPTVQTSQQQQQQTAQQQQFINPTLPPGYNYYYAGGMVPGGYSYTPTVYPVPPVTNAAHAGSTGNPQFQKPGAFTGSHAYGTGYDDLANQSQDFSKTYGASAQTQNKGSGSVAVTSATSDISAAAYGKSHTQSFDKTGFPGGTPPPFNMLPTGSQGGPLGAPAAAYGTTYVPVMAHQAHSQMLHHHLQQDSTGGSSRGSQQTATQAKAAASKSYGPYWGGS